jgi:hypothetical protein
MSQRGLPSVDELFAKATSFTPVHFDPEEFDSFIAQHGTCGRLRRAMVCPCRRAASEQAAVDCPDCFGTGLLYPSSLDVHTTVLLTSRDASTRALSVGQMTTGHLSATFQSSISEDVPLIPGRGDQLWPEGEEHVVAQLLYRGGMPDLADRSEMDWGPEPPPRAVEPERDRLLYPNVLAVEFCAVRGPTGAIELRQGVHFTLERVDRQTYIVWRPGQGPERGRAVSLRYRAQAVYMVAESAPRARMEAGASMPYHAQLHRLDRWGEEGLR